MKKMYFCDDCEEMIFTKKDLEECYHCGYEEIQELVTVEAYNKLMATLHTLQICSERAILGAHGSFLPGQLLDYNLANQRALDALKEQK